MRSAPESANRNSHSSNRSRRREEAELTNLRSAGLRPGEPRHSGTGAPACHRRAGALARRTYRHMNVPFPFCPKCATKRHAHPVRHRPCLVSMLLGQPLRPIYARHKSLRPLPERRSPHHHHRSSWWHERDQGRHGPHQWRHRAGRRHV